MRDLSHTHIKTFSEIAFRERGAPKCCHNLFRGVSQLLVRPLGVARVFGHQRKSCKSTKQRDPCISTPQIHATPAFSYVSLILGYRDPKWLQNGSKESIQMEPLSSQAVCQCTDKPKGRPEERQNGARGHPNDTLELSSAMSVH